MQGCNPSADSVAGIAGSERSRSLTPSNPGSNAINPRGSGTASPFYRGDTIPEQLMGHFR